MSAGSVPCEQYAVSFNHQLSGYVKALFILWRKHQTDRIYVDFDTFKTRYGAICEIHTKSQKFEISNILK